MCILKLKNYNCFNNNNTVVATILQQICFVFTNHDINVIVGHNCYFTPN